VYGVVIGDRNGVEVGRSGRVAGVRERHRAIRDGRMDVQIRNDHISETESMGKRLPINAAVQSTDATESGSPERCRPKVC
jgi:hypothetical protein